MPWLNRLCWAAESRSSVLGRTWLEGGARGGDGCWGRVALGDDGVGAGFGAPKCLMLEFDAMGLRLAGIRWRRSRMTAGSSGAVRSMEGWCRVGRRGHRLSARSGFALRGWSGRSSHSGSVG